MFKLSHLREVLRPTRRREKGGEDAWLPVEQDESCNGNRKAVEKRGRGERDRVLVLSHVTVEKQSARSWACHTSIYQHKDTLPAPVCGC